jgi:enoyl-[acyl-carrier protein] reductase I
MRYYKNGGGWFDVHSLRRRSRSGAFMTAPTFDMAKPGPLMAGKRGLIMGVANDRSIAWGIARVLAGQGAELAFTYQGDAFGRRAIPLAQSVGSKIIEPCDVNDLASVDAVFKSIETTWGSLDFVVHALAFSDRRELSGKYADTSRENFTNTMVISCFSFTEIAKRAAALMPNGGSMITLSFGGATKVVPSYNVMGVAKAALEASVRYLATDFGPQGIRVNALSAGPMRTLAGAGVSDARTIFNYQKDHAPLRRTPSLDEVGGSALYLLSPMSGAVTGEVHFVDCGYSTVAMPTLDALKAHEAMAAAAGRVANEAAE